MSDLVSSIRSLDLAPLRKRRRVRTGGWNRPALREGGEEHLAVVNSPQAMVGYLLVAVVACVIPFLVGGTWVRVFAEASAITVALIGLAIGTSLSGQINLGHSAFMGLAAYLTAWLTSVGWNYLLAAFVAIVAVTLVGAGLVVVLGTLRGVYLATATIGLVIVLEHLIRNLDAFGRFSTVTMPSLSIFGWSPAETQKLGPLELERIQVYYFVTLLVAAVCLYVFSRLRRTVVGRRMAAIRDADLAAGSLGIDVTRTKVIALGLSALFGAVGGILLATTRGSIVPGDYDVEFSVSLVAMLIIGGGSTAVGSVLGALFVAATPRLLEIVGPKIGIVATGGSTEGLTAHQGAVIVYGIALVIVLVVEPAGLSRVWKRIQRFFVRFPLGTQRRS